MSEYSELFDKFINGSLSEDEQRELQELLEYEDIQREFVEYTIETRSYVSMLEKQQKEPSRKIKKQSRVLPVMLTGAAAIIAVFFYLNLPGIKGFSINQSLIEIGSEVTAQTKTKITSSDGSVLTLETGTVLKLVSNEPSEFYLKKGRINVKVSPQRNSFKIRTEESLTEVLGTEFFLDRNENITSLGVSEGEVRFSNGEDSLIVRENEEVHADSNKIYNFSSRYKNWRTWTEEFAKRNDLLLYLNFAGDSQLNNIADSTKEDVKFEQLSGEISNGRWPQKLALKNGGYKTLSTSGLSFTKEITVWAWVKIGNNPGLWPPVILGDVPHWRLQLSKEASQSHVGFTKFADGKKALIKDQWYFLAATFSQDEILLYTNAELDASLDGVEIKNVPKTIFVGMNPLDERVFNGLIDEAAMMKGVLTREQLKEIYEATRP